MRFKTDHYCPKSPYYVAVKTILPYPAPAMGWDDFEMWLVSEVVYKTTVYVSGKRKLVKHHEPKSIPGYNLVVDKTWFDNRRHSIYSAQLRLLVEDIVGRKIGELYLDEIENYNVKEWIETDDGLHIGGETRYEGCSYAGFLMIEVPVDEFKRMKREAKTASK